MRNKFSVSSLLAGLVLGILLVAPAAVIAKDTPATYQGLPTANLVIDGVAMDSERPPVIIDGATYVPLRLVVESLGSTVSWDEATRTVSVRTRAGGGYWVAPVWMLYQGKRILIHWGYWVTADSGD